ncbi:MAG: NADH-quinone oxidoreductase subunit J [Armatimonadota bacterium]|nr:NADH-quinone oxidoreductase subunit J [Armatimonadota bacterium]
MTGQGIAFAVLAAITLISALLVVTIKNIVRSALFLALSFVGVAGLYVLLNAEFLAAVQVLIYVGAITVLILFAIMLTQQIMSARIRQTTEWFWAAIPTTLAMLAVLMIKFALPPYPAHKTLDALPANTTMPLAEALLKPYLLPFELASVILLAALIGAIVIAKEEKHDAAD